MPTRQQVHELLTYLGFKRQPNDGAGNAYVEGQKPTPLAGSWRYQHAQHARWRPNGERGAIYVHAFAHNDDAVLVANSCYRDDMLQPNKQLAPRSGTLSDGDEDGYRDEAIWRALIVLARATR